MSAKFKTGDAVYYRKPVGRTWDTIPGTVHSISAKGKLTIDDGVKLHRNVTPSQCEKQEEPTKNNNSNNEPYGGLGNEW